CRDERTALFPDAIGTLKWLREAGCRLALVTNGAAGAQRQKIERFGLQPLVDLILVEGELGFGKPDARIYQLALRELAVAPEQAWMVGDNLEWDVGQPQTLGLTGVWVDTGRTGLPVACPVRPDLIIDSLGALRTYVTR
ncbi:MAG: HAD family hydrolase, partial [Acidobacteria bacterium]|nr:HAD family hydrolase [Acidobacteriota bacterium]